MNILQIFNGFADRWNANGYYALTLAEALQGLGHSVTCVADPDCRFTIEAQKRGLNIEKMIVDTDNPLRFWAIRKRVQHIIESENIDLVHCHRGKMMPAILSGARAVNPDIKVVRTHGEDRLPRNHALARRERNHLHRIIATTEGMRQYYIDTCSVPSEKTGLAYGAVSHEIHEARQPQDDEITVLDGEPLVLGLLGRPSVVKGHVIAIETLGHLYQETKRRVILKVAGNMPDQRRAQIQAVMKAFEVPEDRVELLGRVEDVPEFIRSIDIGLIPSLRSEMICRVLMEFTAFSKPVFGSQVNAVGEVIDTFNIGLTSPPGEARALADNLLQIINDADKYKTFAENSSRAYADHFNPASFAKTVEGVYGEYT